MESSLRLPKVTLSHVFCDAPVVMEKNKNVVRESPTENGRRMKISLGLQVIAITNELNRKTRQSSFLI